MIQFVAEDGAVTDTGIKHGIDVDLAATLYRDMARARRLDREAFSLILLSNAIEALINGVEVEAHTLLGAP